MRRNVSEVSDMSIAVQKAAEAFYFSTSTPIQFFKERKDLQIFFPITFNFI